MKILALVRHPSPEIDPGLCYGQLDVDVTENFAAEAAEIKEWLQSADIIFTSPLRRARLLADYLAAQLGCASHADTRLQEMHFGEWEGEAWRDIPRHALDAWSGNVLHYIPPQGESAAQMMQRVKEALDEMIALPQRNIAVVAHAGSIRAMLALLGNVPLQVTLNWQLNYGAVILVRIRDMPDET